MPHRRVLAANLGVTGLTARVAVYDADDNLLLAPTAAGVTESPAGSGLYRVAVDWGSHWGNARVVWDDGTDPRAQEAVTAPAPLLNAQQRGPHEVDELLLSSLLYANRVDDHGDGTRTFTYLTAGGTATLATVTHRPADGLRTGFSAVPGGTTPPAEDPPFGGSYLRPPTADELIADGRWTEAGNPPAATDGQPLVRERWVFIAGHQPNGDPHHHATATFAGEYVFDGCWFLGGISAGLATLAPDIRSRVTIVGGGALDQPWDTDGKTQGVYLENADVDLRKFVVSNVAWQPTLSSALTQGVYLFRCGGVVEDLLGDRIGMSLVKCSGPPKLSDDPNDPPGTLAPSSEWVGCRDLTLRRVFVTRGRQVANLSISSFTENNSVPVGFHRNVAMSQVGGEQLGNYGTVYGPQWDAWGLDLRGGDASCGVDGLWLGPTDLKGLTRDPVSAADAEYVLNTHTDGWGDPAAASLLPGGHSVASWGEAIRDGWHPDLVPTVLGPL